MAVREVSSSGALIELSRFHPSWLVPGQELELTLCAEGENESVDLRGPIARVAKDGDDPVFAVRFDRQSRRSRKYLARVIANGHPLRTRI